MSDNQLATRADRRDGPMRDLVKFCLHTPTAAYSVGDALKLLPPRGQLAELDQAIAQYEASLRPLSSTEPKLDGSLTRQVLDAFGPIGAKMRPDMSPSQAAFWATAMATAFSDVAHWVAAQAFGEVVHNHYEFPNEMEKGAREAATRIIAKHRSAIVRLHALKREVLHATGQGQPRVEDKRQDDGPPMTLDEVRTLWAGPMGQNLVQMGLKAGAIREEDVAILKKEAASLGNQCDQGPESSIA